MPKEGLTEIICVIDKSGSMASTAADAIGGFNTFLKAQKELPGDARLTLILFSDRCKVVHESECLDEIVDLTDRNYVPGGSTALLDAVGLGIDKVVEKHEELPEDERPEKIIMVVVTDGGENASKEYRRDVILGKINDCRSKDWEFVFLGADESAFEEASSMGFAKGATRGYCADTSVGVSHMYADMSAAVTCYRADKKVDMTSIAEVDDSVKDKSDLDNLIV